MKKAYLFDLDNTLLIKRPTICERIVQIFNDCGRSVKMDEVSRAYAMTESWQGAQIEKENKTGVRMSDEEYLSNLLAIYDSVLNIDNDTSIIEPLTEALYGRYAKNYCLADCAIETLEKLKNDGLKLGIVSNNHSAIRSIICDLTIDRFFDAIIISEEVGLFKPDPKIIELALSKLEVSPSDAVYIGDHPFDVKCAYDAGVTPIWIPQNEYFTLPDNVSEPEYVISSLIDITQIEGN